MTDFGLDVTLMSKLTTLRQQHSSQPTACNNRCISKGKISWSLPECFKTILYKQLTKIIKMKHPAVEFIN